MSVRYNLDFQLTQRDARAIAREAFVHYSNKRFSRALAHLPMNRTHILDESLTDALERMFEEKFERALNVDYTPSCRILLVVAAYRFFEEKRKQGKALLDYEKDFGSACSDQIEAIAEQMKERTNPNSEYYETEPNDEYGHGIEYELAEDIEHAWYEDDWAEFDHWDKDFHSVASFAVVALSE